MNNRNDGAGVTQCWQAFPVEFTLLWGLSSYFSDCFTFTYKNFPPKVRRIKTGRPSEIMRSVSSHPVSVWVSVIVMSLCYDYVIVMFHFFAKLLQKINIFYIYISILCTCISNLSSNIIFAKEKFWKVAHSLWKSCKFAHNDMLGGIPLPQMCIPPITPVWANLQLFRANVQLFPKKLRIRHEMLRIRPEKLRPNWTWL